MNLTTILRSAKAVIHSRTISTTSVSNAVPLKKSTLTSFMLALSLLFSLLSVESWGQAATYNYSASAGTYTEITGGTVLFASGAAYDDGISASQTINSFTFNGTAYTSMAINTNGWMSLGVSTTVGSYTPLSSAQTGGSAILVPFGRDQTNTSSSEIRWQYLSASNETVIQWKNATPYLASGNINYQVRLNHSTNTVSFVYGSMTVGTNGTSPQVGIKNGIAAGVIGTTMLNLKLKNIPVGTTCLTWADAVRGSLNTETMLFTSTAPAATITSGTTFTFTPQTGASATWVNPITVSAAPTLITSSGATVNFTAPTNANRCNVQYRRAQDCAWTNFSGNPLTVTAASATTIVFTGLQPSTVYHVRIQPYNATSTNVAGYSHIISTTAGTNTDGYVASGSFTTATPTLSSFSPSSQCKGLSITITGTNFSPSAVTGVTINGNAVSSYTVVNSTTITAVTTASQTSGIVAVTYSGGSSSSSSSLTMNSLPTITSSGSVNAVCSSSSAQSSTFNYTASTNSPTSYSIDWNATANTAGFMDVASTSHSFLAGGGSFSVPIGANVAPGVYSGVLSCTNANGCIGTTTISLTITAIPTLSSVTQVAYACFSTQNISNNASIQLSGLLNSTSQTATYNINGGTSQTIAFTSSSSGTATLSVPVVLANNAQTLSITSINCANFTSNNSCVLSIIQAPTAPSVLPLTQTVNVGASATFTGTRSASANTMTWWTAASGGTEIDPDNSTLVDSVFNSYQASILNSPNNSPVAFCFPGLNSSNTTYKYYVQQFHYRHWLLLVRLLVLHLLLMP